MIEVLHKISVGNQKPKINIKMIVCSINMSVLILLIQQRDCEMHQFTLKGSTLKKLYIVGKYKSDLRTHNAGMFYDFCLLEHKIGTENKTLLEFVSKPFDLKYNQFLNSSNFQFMLAKMIVKIQLIPTLISPLLPMSCYNMMLLILTFINHLESENKVNFKVSKYSHYNFEI